MEARSHARGAIHPDQFIGSAGLIDVVHADEDRFARTCLGDEAERDPDGECYEPWPARWEQARRAIQNFTTIWKRTVQWAAVVDGSESTGGLQGDQYREARSPLVAAGLLPHSGPGSASVQVVESDAR